MGNEEAVFYSRVLTETTLSFHIIYATIGVGIPLMIMIAQWVGIRKNDEHYILLARRWARGFVITVAVGVVTGTAIGLQLSLLWPNFMEFAGHVIALPLFMETFAFFFEAIFLGIYLYTWDRFENQKKHLLLLVPVAVGASFSAVFITMVNVIYECASRIRHRGWATRQHQPDHCDVQPGDADQSGACRRYGIYDRGFLVGGDCSVPVIERLRSYIS